MKIIYKMGMALEEQKKEIREKIKGMRRSLQDKKPIDDYVPDVKMIHFYNQALSDLLEEIKR